MMLTSLSGHVAYDIYVCGDKVASNTVMPESNRQAFIRDMKREGVSESEIKFIPVTEYK